VKLSGGARIVRFDMDANAWAEVEEDACVATWASSGSDHAAGQVCGRTRGTRPLGDLWLCPHHYRGVLTVAVQHAQATIASVVPLGTCVLPQFGISRLNPPFAPLCGNPASTTIGTAGICAHHIDYAFAWHREMSDREAEISEVAKAGRRESFEAQMKSWKAEGPQVVYYLLRADRTIKIGTTTRLAERRSALQCEHGPMELLLTHCGAYRREAQVHSRFRALRAEKREWFRPGAELLEWIASTRRKRDNARTVLPGTVPLGRVLGLLREAREQEAA
jgi:hypothetical protein